MTDRELFKMALDCLENAVDSQQSEIDMHIQHYGEWYRPARVEFMKEYLNKTNQSIESIRARLAQPEPEPVAHLWECLGRWSAMIAHDGEHADLSPPSWLCDAIQVATAPPKKEWVGLTDEEIQAVHYELKVQMQGAIGTIGMYRMLEKALREKNNAS